MKTDYFHKIDSEDKAYWLGFILGDGCLRKDSYCIEIGLKASDDGHLLKFARIIEWDKELQYRKQQIVGYAKVYNSVRIEISNKEMYTDLLNLGLTSAKSLTAKWLKIPKKYERHMLRGLFDADGSVCSYRSYGAYRYARFSLAGTINCMKNANRILKIDSKITLGCGKCWIIRKSGNPSVLKIYNILYKNATVWLDRKKERFEDLLKIAALPQARGIV